MYKSIFIVLGMVLIIAVASSPSITSAIPNRSNDTNAWCSPTGNSTANGGEEVECCWAEKVTPGTGGVGDNNYETYCSNCENGGTRGNINCSDPELQYRQIGKPLPPISGTINSGQISDDTINSNNNDNPNPDMGPNEGLERGSDDIQRNNNNIQSPPDSEADESTIVTTNTPRDQSPEVQTENTSESSLN
jgi:hypothetical protein